MQVITSQGGAQIFCSPSFLGMIGYNSTGYSSTGSLLLEIDCESLSGSAMFSVSSIPYYVFCAHWPLRDSCGQWILSMLVLKKNLLTVFGNN